MHIFNVKTHCCNSTFSDVRFALLLTKNMSPQTNCFVYMELPFPQLYCLKLSFKFCKLYRSYYRKTKGDVSGYAYIDTFCGSKLSCW